MAKSTKKKCSHCKSIIEDGDIYYPVGKKKYCSNCKEWAQEI